MTSNHFNAHYNVTKQLTIICVVIFWEIRQLIYLSNIMEHSCGQKQITIDHWVKRDFDEALAHLAGNVGQHLVPVGQAHLDPGRLAFRPFRSLVVVPVFHSPASLP